MNHLSEEYVLVINADNAERHYWADLWRYRELFYFLAWRDIVVRYKQTVLGITWALVRPLLTMLVFTLVFGKLARLPSDGMPYPVLVFSALLPWQLFANGFSEASSSLISNSNMISKVYFPRLIIPVSTLAVSVVDFLISLALLAALMAWYGIAPGWRILALPLLTIMAAAAAMGVGLWAGALNVKFRDFRYIVPFALILGLYVSPVGFSSSIVPENWRLLYSLNPMVGIIDGFRWALLGGDSSLYLPGLGLSVLVIAIALVGGIGYFRRAEKSFADVI